MSLDKRFGKTLALDALAMLPGWLALFVVDPYSTGLVGLPVAALLVLARRRFWSAYPTRGRIAAGALLPLVGLFVTTTVVFGSTGPSLGLLLAASLVALVEGWSLRQGRTLLRCFPLATAAIFLALGALFTALLLGAGVIRYPTEDFIKLAWTAPEPPDWSAQAKQGAATAVDYVVEREVRQADEIERAIERLAPQLPELVAAEAPHGVWVTLYERSGYRSRGFASGGANPLVDVLAAAAAATERDPRKPRSRRTRESRWHKDEIGTRLQIDVVGRSVATHRRPVFTLFEGRLRAADPSLQKVEPLARLFDLVYEIEPGVDGIEIRRPDDARVAVVLPAEPVTEGWFTPRVRSGPQKLRSMLRRAWKETYGESLDVEAQRFEVRKFRTRSFGRPRTGAPVVDWYRGNVLIEGELSRERLVRGTALAANWLARMVKPDGRFHYEIYPPYKRETQGYNLPRHAGSIYGLLAVHTAGRTEPALAPAGERALVAALGALDYVSQNLGKPASKSVEDELCFLSEKGDATSGSTALAAISLCELPAPDAVADPQLRERVAALPRDEWLAGMGACMLAMIDPDGAVFHDFEDAERSERVEKEPLYFPGEVMLALVRSHRILEDERLLEGARRIADRQLGMYGWQRALGVPAVGDHWIIQALFELAAATGDERYAELSVLLGRGYVQEQHPPQEYAYPDYRGAYRRMADQPRTTRAASRGEALGAAMRAARLLGEDTGVFEDALIDGARHLLEQQFTEHNTHFVPEGFDVDGAIRMGLTDNHCRIDNNQHALVALIAALEAVDLRAAR